MNETPKGVALNWVRPLVYLLPAMLAAIFVFVTLPRTEPVLRAIPEQLELALDAIVEAAPQEEPVLDEPEPEPVAVGSYEDGVYTGSARGYGGTVEVQVTVEGGQIVDVTILRAPGETEPYFTLARTVIPIVLQQQTWEVDAISGATYSSRGILGAIQNAITGETVENEAPAQVTRTIDSEGFVEPAAYLDGTYTGSAQGFGGKITVQVTIEGGVLKSISILSAPGETEPYFSNAKAVIDRMLAAGSPNVDTVSGATYSSTGIITATKRALAQAAAEHSTEEPEENEDEERLLEIDPAVRPATELTDGVYVGVGEGYGGEIEVQVTVQDGRITDVTVRSAKYETEPYFTRACTLIPYILSTQGTDVDTVSGATFSSRGILEAVNAALLQASAAEETPTQPEPENEPPAAPGGDPAPAPGPEQDNTTTDGRYVDGVYSASGWCEDEDGMFRYALTVTVTVSEGKIASVAVEKWEDESLIADPEDNENYLGLALEGRTRRGVTYTGVPAQIVSRQSADEVDAVSGATYSSGTIRVLAAQAIAQALVPQEDVPGDDPGEVPGEEPGEVPGEEPGEVPGEEPGEVPGEEPGEVPGEEPGEDPGENPGEEPTDEPANDTPFADGTYSASAWCDDEVMFLYRLTVTLTVRDGSITAVDVVKGEDESEEPEDNEYYLSYAMKGRTRLGVFYPGIPAQIISAQSADGVDVVSGATYSSRTILTAARQAIAQAVAAKQEGSE
ncbi:MAG: FMN-binding protein [Oscillospiraceae bacterium]|nr:FMN-binding protein [Oscillospiraceae bacterium]